MKNMEKANKLTLNKIQEALLIKANKTAFLRMIFPITLQHGENGSLVDFMFNPDPSFQNIRSIFINGNITRKKKKPTYSRASQEVLNFIAENMNNNSCLIDMTELLSKNFPNITPELIDRLQEIDDDIYTDSFRKILNNATDLYRKLAYLILWSVFGERINCINFSFDSEEKNQKFPSVYRYFDIIEYFNSNMKSIDEIESVELAFMSGVRWLMDDERIDIIQRLLDHNIKINILIADANVSEFIAKEMRIQNKTYLTLSQGYEIWKEFSSKNNNLVTVKISRFPLLHSYCSFNMKNNKSSVFYILYTYGNIGFRKRPAQKLDCTSEHYQTLKDEFEYLWKISE